MPLYLYSPVYHFGDDFDNIFSPNTLFVRPSSSRHHDKGASPVSSQKEEPKPKHQEAEKENGNNNLQSASWNGLFQHQQQLGVQLHEDDSSYFMTIDLPGVKASDMSLKLEDDNDGKTVVHLSGHRKLRSSDGSHISENKFSKRFTIGKNVDIDKLSANLCDGVLTLMAPKKAPPAAVVREIKITQGNGNADTDFVEVGKPNAAETR